MHSQLTLWSVMLQCVLLLVCALLVQQGADAGACTKDKVRLQQENEESAYGRVEYCPLYKWKSVCSKTWGVEEARVVCRELGFGVAVPLKQFDGGNKNRTVLFDCNGEEDRLANCNKLNKTVELEDGECNGERDDSAGVFCYNESITDQPDSSPLPAGSSSLPAGSSPLPAGSSPLPADSSPLPASSSPLPASSSPLPAASSPLPASSSPLPAASSPLPVVSAVLFAVSAVFMMVAIVAVVVAMVMVRRKKKEAKNSSNLNSSDPPAARYVTHKDNGGPQVQLNYEPDMNAAQPSEEFRLSQHPPASDSEALYDTATAPSFTPTVTHPPPPSTSAGAPSQEYASVKVTPSGDYSTLTHFTETQSRMVVLPEGEESSAEGYAVLQQNRMEGVYSLLQSV